MAFVTWFALGFGTCATVVYVVDVVRAHRPTFKRLERTLPGAAMELVGEREEVVVYTGWTITIDGRLVAMSEFDD